MARLRQTFFFRAATQFAGAICAGLIVLGASVTCVQAQTGRLPKDAVLIEGFEKVVFGSEIPGLFGGGHYIKRFERPVRFFIDNAAEKDRRRATARFIRSLDRQIQGLSTATAETADDADFVVHIVDRADYQSVGRRIYGNPFMSVPGNCIVRSSFSRKGIRRSDAVIVSDDGERLFDRCLIEEILQGLGPLNDYSGAPDSVFNDETTLAAFTLYDRAILNMLYDPRLKAGMGMDEVRPLLADILRDVRRRLRG